ncbi:MAG: nitroreductase family protein [Romboutsia sp.]
MELYDAIFYRKSIKKYSNIRIKEYLMDQVKDICSNITYLNDDLNIKAHVVERGHLIHFLMGKGCKIKAPHYIVVTSNNGDDYLQNIGFAMENVVLQMTTLGLATCWIDCSLKRKDILEFVDLEEIDEENPENPYAVIAFGYPEKSDDLFRRKKDKLDREKVKDISKKVDKSFEDAMEAVRFSPSIKNIQPWFFHNSKNGFHIYERNQKRSINDMSKISMGIALRHFDIGCKKSNIDVKYEKLDAKNKIGKIYFISIIE